MTAGITSLSLSSPKGKVAPSPTTVGFYSEVHAIPPTRFPSTLNHRRLEEKGTLVTMWSGPQRPTPLSLIWSETFNSTLRKCTWFPWKEKSPGQGHLFLMVFVKQLQTRWLTVTGRDKPTHYHLLKVSSHHLGRLTASRKSHLRSPGGMKSFLMTQSPDSPGFLLLFCYFVYFGS